MDATTGTWFVTTVTGQQRDDQRTCRREHPGSTFAVPAGGNHAQRLVDAKQAAGATDVWLAYAVSNGTWTGVAA